MKINAISSCNYAQNNNKQNFKGLCFKDATIQTIAKNCSIDEIKILKAAAADKIDLETLLGISDFSNPVVEHLFLKLGKSAKDLKLLYEPYINENRIPGPITGFGEAGRLRSYTLGGKFEILGYVPPLQEASDRIFDTNGSCLDLGQEIPKLQVLLDENNTSSFKVYASCLDVFDIKNIKSTLKNNGFIPNEACPIPTERFIRAIVKKVYNYLINENIAKMTDAEKAKLAEETKALRQKYASEQLGNFIYSV